MPLRDRRIIFTATLILTASVAPSCMNMHFLSIVFAEFNRLLSVCDWLAKKKVYSPLNLINHSLKQRLWNKLQIKCTFICLVFKLLLIGLCGVSTLLRLNRSCHVFECVDSLLPVILYFQYWPFELNLLVWCVVYRCVSPACSSAVESSKTAGGSLWVSSPAHADKYAGTNLGFFRPTSFYWCKHLKRCVT